MQLNSKAQGFVKIFSFTLFLFTLSACPGGGQKPSEPIVCDDVDCEIACEFGFATGDDGCEICSCNEEPVCPAIGCADDCENGYEQDENGCNTCSCLDEDPCSDLNFEECDESDECELSYDYLNDHLEEPDCACDSDETGDEECDCKQTRPAPQCVVKQQNTNCNPYGENECPTGQHCEEVRTSTGGNQGETPPPPLQPAPEGICVDNEEIPCSLYNDFDSCPDGFECQELPQPQPVDGEPRDDRTDPDAPNDDNGIREYPEGVCVEKVVYPDEICYSSEDCVDGYICTVELGECDSPRGDGHGNIDTVCVGQCIPEEPQVVECLLFDEDSCPQGQHCEELSMSTDPSGPHPFPAQPLGICVDDQPIPTRCEDLSIERCEQNDECRIEAIEVQCDCPPDADECNCPDIAELICVPNEPEVIECYFYGEETCPEGQHCEVSGMDPRTSDPRPDPLPPIGICVDNDIPSDRCAELPIERCEQTPQCRIEEISPQCDCPPDADCECPDYIDLICVPNEPQPEEFCASSSECDERSICTVELGECDSYPGNGFDPVPDVCVGKCIPRDMPARCEDMSNERCEQNQECELLDTPGNCECPDEEDIECDCFNEPICVERQTPIENNLCSTDVPCNGQQECEFEVCTEDRNGEMGTCFGHCIDTDPSGCIQVEQAAISPNGYCVVFPTPCEVPQDWEPVDSCE